MLKSRPSQGDGDLKNISQLLRSLPSPSRYIKVAKVSPYGTLQARRQAGGAVLFYWRINDGKRDLRPLIGCWDSSAPPRSLKATQRGYSIPAAIRAAEELALKHFASKEEGGYAGLIEKEKKGKLSREQQEQEAAEQTLQALCLDYLQYLQDIGRPAYKDAGSILRLHVMEAFPEMANKPAREVTKDDVAQMMRRLIKRGNGRTANKLRSYLRSAYSVAAAATSKPNIPEHFNRFKIEHNPAGETFPDESANRSDKNPLMTDEMFLYWDLISKAVGLKGAVLRLHVLTGGQRISQLVRLRVEDVHQDFIKIYDGKGRPGKPARIHIVPLIPAARKELELIGGTGRYAISSDGGETPIHNTTMSHWANEVVGDRIKDFQLKRIRSGIETLLARHVTREIRGRLQSHGISGVQDRHYDAYDYFDEKYEALSKMFDMLTTKSLLVSRSARNHTGAVL